MLFLLNDRRYAIDLENVAEVAGMLTWYPVPRTPRFIRGVVNVHGRVTSVMDLGMYMGAGPTKNGQNLLILHSPDTGLALVVEHMERIITAEEINAIEPGEGELEHARLVLDDGRVTLLAVEPLLASVEKMLGS
jgi:purine-binding chemotaxis protein CheW